MSATKDKTDFTIKQQWDRFMERCGMAPGEMPKVQETEMSKAFYGSAGQILIMIRDEVSELKEEDAVVVLDNMMDEIMKFWQDQVAEHEKGENNA